MEVFVAVVYVAGMIIFAENDDRHWQAFGLTIAFIGFFLIIMITLGGGE